MKYPAYPDYKDSPIPWLPKVPANWEVHRLKWAVTSCDNGVWGEEPDGGPDDVACIRVADFDRLRFSVSADNLTMRSIDARQRASRQVRNGDLLVEKSGGGEKQLVGCVVQFEHDFPAVCSNFVARMGVAEGQNSRYWTYAHAALYAGRLNDPAIKQTTGIQNLDASEYLNNLFAYAPAEEQKKIADFLDWRTAQIDALIAKKQALLEQLSALRLNAITSAVTKGTTANAPTKDSGIAWIGTVPKHWLVPPLKMRYAVELGKMLDEKRITGSNLFPYLRNVDVQWQRINWDDLPQMDIDAHELERYTVAPGDVLVCEGGEVGRAAVVEKIPGTIGYQKALHRLRSHQENELPKFVYYTLIWAASTKVFDVEGASTIAHLTADQLRRYRFPQPPLNEQKEICSFLDALCGKIEHQTEKVNEAIDRLTEYRSALITAAVTGQIDVRGVKVPATI